MASGGQVPRELHGRLLRGTQRRSERLRRSDHRFRVGGVRPNAQHKRAEHHEQNEKTRDLGSARAAEGGEIRDFLSVIYSHTGSVYFRHEPTAWILKVS